ncbi:hypothetical protein [Chitinophaga sp. XS-30]|uniref:hypothetical protein n=1 Tax=Chitinophaga sp. XS-30 TaxID=2604421 RepID=UPI0011DD9B1A|nr:hypothetical protein [Chitinophaga sp. XS-30]QEH43734.1 hypothetical protein FW415_23900 [Chitinophaga sp. XS-30]
MKRNNTLTRAALTICTGALLCFASCSKNNDVIADEKITLEDALSLTIPDGDSATLSSNGSQGKIYNDGGIYTVANFRQSYSSGPGQPADGNFYWDFPNNDAGNPGAHSIKFSGIATGDITASGSNEIRFIDVYFDDVEYGDWSSASTPQASPAGSGVIGMDEVTGTGVPPAVAAYANGAGWYIYQWTPSHHVIPVPDRTLLWKSGSTIYKFDISSIYQNGVTGGAFPYYNFRYQQLTP